MSDAKTANPAETSQKSRPRSRFRKLRLTALLFVLAVTLLFVPPVFQLVLRNVIVFEAWQHSATVRIEKVQGSLFEPVAVTGVQWTQIFPDSAVIRLEVASAEAEFSWRWRDLISDGGERWFRRLSLNGVTGKLELPPKKTAEQEAESEPEQPNAAGKQTLLHTTWWPTPERFEARAVDFVVQSNNDFVRIENSGGVFSQVEPGAIHAKQVAVKQGWFSRTFRDVRGTTAIEDSAAVVGNLTVEPGVEVRSLSADLPALAEGRLNAEVQIAAFGGELRAQIETLRGQPGTGIDASGKFSQIGVAPLASFLNLSDAAGGVIKEGQFTFRGKPRNIGHATVSLRLQANNFQWESRQWDSLLFSATLRERRIEVPNFELHQGSNQLILSGDLTLPEPNKEWWQSDFATNVSAHIGNLTELSALMLPEFKYTAGRMDIDGHVRGHGEDFHGAVVAFGSNITWHDAPIEELRAAIRLNGNELHLENLDLLNKDDYVRVVDGRINILGAKQYWGEIRASIADLSTYAAILQKPIVPEPLAGGAVIRWSGQGSAKGYSGKFFAHLNKLRTVGATGAMLHPVNAELEGDYTEDLMEFSTFSVSDDQSSFSANVKVGNKALSLGSMQLVHGADTWLEGDAVLPLDIWQAWPNASLDTLLNDQTPVKANLTLKSLQLHEAAQLTGWKWPLEGILDGTLHGDGKIGALVTSGRLTLSKGRIPIDWNGDALTGVEGEFGFEGQTVRVDKMQCIAPAGGKFTTTGQIDFTNIRDPALQLTLKSEQFTQPLFPGLQYQAEREGEFHREPMAGLQTTLAFDLAITGPLSAATIGGNASLLGLSLGGEPDVTAFWLGSNPSLLPPAFTWQNTPWQNWRFAITCAANEPLAIQDSPGKVQPSLKLGGTGAAPALTGSVQFTDLATLTPIAPMTIEQCTLEFREGHPNDPSVDLRARAEIANCQVIAQAAGPLSHCLRIFQCEPPLTPQKVRNWLASPPDPLESPEIAKAWLRRDAIAVAGNVQIFDWAIPTPAEADASPANGSAPPLPSPTAPAAREAIQ